MENVSKKRFEVLPRDQRFGGGWEVKLFDREGVEVLCGIFPSTEKTQDNVNAFNKAMDMANAWIE